MTLPPESARAPDASTRLSLERTVLAFERTMLSWVRTATTLISFGFSIQQFFRMARAGAAERSQLVGPDEFGLAMILTGLSALLLAALKHRSDIKTLKLQHPEQDTYPAIPRSRAAILAALIAVLGMLALFSMVF
jgi:putative membrane protein